MSRFGRCCGRGTHRPGQARRSPVIGRDRPLYTDPPPGASPEITRARPGSAAVPSPPHMPRTTDTPFALAKSDARRIWLHAQRLDRAAPFGDGPQATPAAVAQLGYVQIDTINVIE